MRHGETHFGLPINGIWERDLNGSLVWVSRAPEEAGWVKVVQAGAEGAPDQPLSASNPKARAASLRVMAFKIIRAHVSLG